VSDMNEERDAIVTLELTEGYRFRVDFDLPGVPTLLIDEPTPIGEGVGPNAARVLAAAVGNCLSASALYCLEKAARGRARDADHGHRLLCPQRRRQAADRRAPGADRTRGR
jgi:hypothetical protein